MLVLPAEICYILQITYLPKFQTQTLYLNQCQIIVNLTIWNNLVTSELIFKTFFIENTIDNVISKMSAIMLHMWSCIELIQGLWSLWHKIIINHPGIGPDNSFFGGHNNIRAPIWCVVSPLQMLSDPPFVAYLALWSESVMQDSLSDTAI